jgi:hypothetical protein
VVLSIGLWCKNVELMKRTENCGNRGLIGKKTCFFCAFYPEMFSSTHYFDEYLLLGKDGNRMEKEYIDFRALSLHCTREMTKCDSRFVPEAFYVSFQDHLNITMGKKWMDCRAI